MQVGVVKEIKDKENRVALTPDGAQALSESGHTVVVQTGAGAGSGFPDAQYRQAGARLVSAPEAWDSDLVVKVKEPLETEYPFLQRQILFTYLHLAGVTRTLTAALLKQQTTAVAYETVEDADGRLPLLAPMSAVAGNMAITIGSYYLAKFNHGKGMQLGTVLGRRYGKVVIIGDGVVGQHAAQSALGLGTQVFLAGRHAERASQLQHDISPALSFFVSTPERIAHHVEDADLVVGAVLLRGAKAPYVVTEAMVQRMQPGSVIVDVSIDQGGCVETARPTSHSEPVFTKHAIIHYCVTNMPGAYPRTSTMALTAATLPYIRKLADNGLQALRDDAGFAKGVNTCAGYVTSQPVAAALGLVSQYRDFSTLSQ
jgi:alanine dehydrogenase